MLKVIGSKVLVKVDKPSTCTQKIGGLEIPVGPGAGEYEVAHVIAVGEEVKEVKVDDTMYIYFNSGKKFTHDNVEYRVLTLNEIIAII